MADLDTRRHDFHVAIENWQHDFNIGTIVRSANAFLAREVHIVGKKRWNRRGAMVTDRYQHVRHHESVESLAAYLHEQGVTLMGIDNLPGSEHLETWEMPRSVCFLFGQEGPGLSEATRGRAATGPSRSPSSARPARSTPRPRPRSRCTRGSAGTPTSGPPGAAEPASTSVQLDEAREWPASALGLRQRMNRSPAFQPSWLGGCQKPPNTPRSCRQRARATRV